VRRVSVSTIPCRKRYEKISLAPDADLDGLHVRNLIITYFFRFFEQLVHDGHVYLLETPLFRVRNKEKTIYCYSEAERDNAVKELGGKPEITRFKGLGEISPKEFAQCLGKQMRPRCWRTATTWNTPRAPSPRRSSTFRV
jgi:DNA gyrase/topoisomerase IV subunit B